MIEAAVYICMNYKLLSKITTEDEMVEWHHQFNGHEFEQTLGENQGQESLQCYSPWVTKSWTRLSN